MEKYGLYSELSQYLLEYEQKVNKLLSKYPPPKHRYFVIAQNYNRSRYNSQSMENSLLVFLLAMLGNRVETKKIMKCGKLIIAYKQAVLHNLSEGEKHQKKMG